MLIMTPEILELADKICLDCTAIASSIHYLYYYGDKVNAAEAVANKRKLIQSMKNHVERCNTLIASID